MALSENELRLLEQLERALSEDDPKLASTLRGSTSVRRARQVAIVAGLGFVAGVAVLLTGAVQHLTLVGVVGFVIMLAAASVGLGAVKDAQFSDADPDDQVNDDRLDLGDER